MRCGNSNRAFFAREFHYRLRTVCLLFDYLACVLCMFVCSHVNDFQQMKRIVWHKPSGRHLAPHRISCGMKQNGKSYDGHWALLWLSTHDYAMLRANRS